jgi:hypothetical protein
VQLTAFILVVIYFLQGCTVTNKVLNLAKGIDKGTISASADVEGIWNDQLQNEFIICMKDK